MMITTCLILWMPTAGGAGPTVVVVSGFAVEPWVAPEVEAADRCEDPPPQAASSSTATSPRPAASHRWSGGPDGRGRPQGNPRPVNATAPCTHVGVEQATDPILRIGTSDCVKPA